MQSNSYTELIGGPVGSAHWVSQSTTEGPSNPLEWPSGRASRQPEGPQIRLGGSSTEPRWTKISCKGALGWSIRYRPGGKDEYYERAVALSYVGDGPHLLLGIERIKPGEGELTVAIRLLREAASRNNRYSDIICADAYYAVAPFIKGYGWPGGKQRA